MGTFGLDSTLIQVADTDYFEFQAGSFGDDGGIIPQEMKNTLSNGTEADKSDIYGFHDEGFPSLDDRIDPTVGKRQG